MEYIYQAGKEEQDLLILLHGTGGDEHQMLSVGKYLNPDAGILSIRGNVSENGMNRYFKRKAEGVYDLDDLKQRGEELYRWTVNFVRENKLDLAKAVYVGFSNGANIAINMLLQKDAQINRGILLAPMYPVEVDPSLDLSQTSVFLSLGENDPICPPEESQRVIDLFEARGSQVTTTWVNSHEISQSALDQGKVWLKEN